MGVVSPARDVISEFAPLAAAPRLLRAPAAVGDPVPPLATGKLPATSVVSVTAAGVQLVPLYRRSWLATGAVTATVTPRIRATVEAAVVPVTSPARFDALVALTVILVRPAPLPKNAPTMRFATFVIVTTPFSVFEPVKAW